MWRQTVWSKNAMVDSIRVNEWKEKIKMGHQRSTSDYWRAKVVYSRKVLYAL